MATKAIKRLEVYLGGQWTAWVVGENGITSITKSGMITRQHDEAGRLLTYINLCQVPAYTIGY
jgi:hypothetical protein